MLGGGERDAVAVLAGFDPERDREMALAGPGGPIRQTLACSSIQASWARCITNGRSAEGWAVKSKSSSVLWAGNPADRVRCLAPDASRANTSASHSVSSVCTAVGWFAKSAC